MLYSPQKKDLEDEEISGVIQSLKTVTDGNIYHKNDPQIPEKYYSNRFI